MIPHENDVIIGVTVEKYTCTKIAYNSFREAQAVINYGKNHHKYVNGRRINKRMVKKTFDL